MLTSQSILAIQSARFLLHASKQLRRSSPFLFDFQHQSSQCSHNVTHSSCRRCFSSGLISKGTSTAVCPTSNAGASSVPANAPDVAANVPNSEFGQGLLHEAPLSIARLRERPIKHKVSAINVQRIHKGARSPSVRCIAFGPDVPALMQLFTAPSIRYPD